MATAKEGGNTTSSSYGVGGAGGKFPKKPSRRSAKPYDRPPTALRVNNDNNSSWLRKLVVEPASKIISYGADRFFAPLLRKRLPPPPPHQPPETEADISDGVQGAVRDIQGVQELPCDCSQPVNSSSSNGISELEQMLKQRTFTRSEIVHLRELLQSRAVEVSLDNVGQKNEETAPDYARHQQFASGLVEENRNGGNISPFMLTPIPNSKVPVDENASPAELAKAYMGSRPSKVSPSVLGMRNRVRDDTGLLNSFPSASASPIMALTKKTPSSLAAPNNGFITPRSRGRSAIYNMARTPYFKFHPSSNLKGSGIKSFFLSPVKSNEKLESCPMSLKRRSTFLDDELGSARRTRQKSNLLASGIHQTTHGVVIGSHAKQKLPLVCEPSYSKDVGETENASLPHARVPSKSSEVATKILQQLEKFTPKENSSESKLVARREKLPLTLTPSMLSGRALRSMDDVNSSNVQDDQKLGDSPNATLADVSDFSKEKVEENGPKEKVAPSYKGNHVAINDSVLSLKASTSSADATKTFVKAAAASQPPQKKRAFRMSAQEDYFEQDDDAHCNGLASRPFSEKKGPPEEPKLERPSIQSADKTPLAFVPSKTGELNVFSPASEAVQPLPVAAFEKSKEANNPPLFSVTSKAVEKVASLSSESNKEAELKIGSSSSSLINVSASTGSQVRIPESDKSHHPNLFKAGDENGKSDLVPSAASNGPPPQVSSPLPVSFLAASNDVNQISKGSSALPNTSSTGSIFGLTANPSSLAGPVFKFGATQENSTTKFSAASTTTSVSVVADLGTNTDMGTSSGSSLSNVSTFPTVSSVTNPFGQGLSGSFPAPKNSIFGSVAGNGFQSTTSTQPLASLPDLSSNSLGSTSSSQVVNPSNAFGFSSAVSDPTTSVVKFGASLTEGSAVSSSSGASFSFGGFSSSSSSTSAANGTSTAPLFGFSANSLGSAAAVAATASSLSSGAPATFTFASNTSSASSQSAPASTLFSSSFTSPAPSTGYSFSAFTTASPSVGQQQHPVFGNPAASGFGAAASPDQMNAEDSMAEDTVTLQTSAAPPIFGQQPPTPPASFAFGLSPVVSQQPTPFMFSGHQQNQEPPQNTSPFQASGSLDFNAGAGSFSLGSGGGDKSGRKMVKISKNRNRKK